MSSDKPSYVRHVLGNDDKSKLRDLTYLPYDNRSGSLQLVRVEDYSVWFFALGGGIGFPYSVLYGPCLLVNPNHN